MRTRTALLLALAGVAAVPHDVAAQDAGGKAPPPPAPAGTEVTAEQRDVAIAKGCAWLDDNIASLQDRGSPQKQYAEAAAAWAYLLLASRKEQAGIPQRGKQLD